MSQPSKDNKEQSDKSSPETGNYLVCKGAVCQCTLGGVPAMLKIADTKYYANGKLLATVKDIDFEGGGFTLCSANPQSYKCIYNMGKGVKEWGIDGGDEHPTAGGEKILTTSGKITCPEKGGQITVMMHGQTINVPPELLDEIPSSVLMAINCLVPDEAVIREEVKDALKKASVKAVTAHTDYDYQDSDKNKHYNVTFASTQKAHAIRTNTPLLFQADSKGNTINWAILEEKDNKVTAQNVYMSCGNEFALAFTTPGTYVVVAFGRQGAFAFKETTDKGCFLRFKVEKKPNGIDSLQVLKDGKVLPSTPYIIEEHAREKSSKPPQAEMEGYEIWKGEKATIQVKLKYPPTPEELNNLSITARAYGEPPWGPLPPPVRSWVSSWEEKAPTERKYEYLHESKGEDRTELMPPTKIYYLIEAAVGNNQEGKKEALLFAADNDILRIEEDKKVLLSENGKVRTNTRLAFTCHAKEELEKETKIVWELWDDKEQLWNGVTTGEKRHVFVFDTEGDYYVKAYVKRSTMQKVFRQTQAGGTYKGIQVRTNKMESIAGVESTSIGEVVTFTAKTLFRKMTEGEAIHWQVELKEGSAGEELKAYNIERDILACPQWKEATLKSQDIKMKFMQIGTYCIKASLNNGKAVEKLVKVEKAKVLEWNFTDKSGKWSPAIGWGTEFYANLRVKGWENRKFKITMWYDNRRRCDSTEPGEVHRKRFQKLTEIEVKTDSQGCVRQLVGKKDSGLWSTLDRIKEDESQWMKMNWRYEETAALFFTVSLFETIWDYKRELFSSSWEPCNGQFFPQDNEGTYTYTKADTSYSGYFADATGKKLTDIIRYGDKVKIMVTVCSSRMDQADGYRYRLRVMEDIKGEEKEAFAAREVGDLTPEGKIESDITDLLNPNGHNKSTPQIPRFFYFVLERSLKTKTDFTPIFNYPTGYKADKKNDRDTIVFESENHTGEEYMAWSGLNRCYVLDKSLKPGWMTIPLSEQETKAEADKLAEEVNRKAERENEEKLKKSPNYFYLLKVALEPEAQRRCVHREPSPVRIGEGKTVEKQQKGKCICRENNFAWSAKLTCEQRKKVLAVCTELWGEENKLEKANQLMTVMRIESNFDPKANNGKGYVGLIQFGVPAAKSVGTTQEALVKMTFIEQMDYVKKYLEKQKGKLNTRVDLYLLVMKPNAIGNGSNRNYAIFDESIEDTLSPNRSLWRDPWVKKYGYASNPLYMVEKDEKVLRKRKRYDGKEKEMYGFIGGKTYVWEVDQIIEEQYQKGLKNKFSGECKHQPDNRDNEKRAPWMLFAIQEFNAYKGIRQRQSPLKERISNYFATISYKGTYKDSWCGAFIHFCFDSTEDYKKTNWLGGGAAYDWLPPNKAKAKRSDIDGWKEGELITNIEDVFYGAVIVFSHSHVAFIIGQSEDGKNFIYLGGNQSDDKEGDGPGNRVICTNPKSKVGFNKSFWIVKPKNYKPTEGEKNLPYVSPEGTELDYNTTH